MSRKKISLACLWLIYGCSIALAQVTTAGISGIVTDDSGAVLPGVSMVVKNLDTGQARAVITDDAGRYRAPELTLGNYEVQAELAGFQTTVRSGIKLTLGREATVDITLKVGAITEKVVVQGEAPLVETTSATVAGLVDDKKIRDLPLNGRSFTQLALLQEGVTSPSIQAGGQPGNEGQKVSIGGTRVSQTAFLLDGSDIRGNYGTTPGSVAGVLLGVDTVREFSVITSAASAEYGGMTGGIVNAVTRSGTNVLHGSLFEFLRNSALDARNFFDATPAPPPFKRNQFGLTVGGPVRKDRTFFFGSYEALRDRLTNTIIRTVPDENTHRGILPPARGGNVGVDPRVKPYLDIYPLPNGRNFGDGTGELILTDPRPTNEHYFMAKIDHQLGAEDSLFARYTFDDGSKTNLGSLPVWRELRSSRSQFLGIDEKKVISPKLVNQARLAFNRNKSLGETAELVRIDPALRFIPLPDRGQGAISVGGITGWGPSATSNGLNQVLNRFEYADNVVYISGGHAIKTGFQFTRMQFNLINPVRAHGTYQFSNLADFLQARASVFDSVLTPLIKQGLRESMVSAYVQDDFKMLANFTLNLGLRYEAITNPTEVRGRYSNLDEPSQTQLRVGNPLLARNPSLKNFAPRVGFAWDPLGDGKMSVRGGFGVFYDLFLPSIMLGPQYNPPYFPRISPANPPFPNVYATVTDISKILPAIYNYKTPLQAYVMQYNLTLQRQLSPLTVITVGYQGTRGVKLSRLVDANIAIPQVVNGRYFFPTDSRRRNPAFDQMRNYFWDANSFFNSFRLGISRRFGSGFQWQSSYTFGKAIDEASNTANFDGPASPNGVSNVPDDHKFERGLSSFDVRHVYAFNGTYELPFGAGRSWGSGARGVAGMLIGGWQASGLVTAHTGESYNLRLSFERSRSRAALDLSERPDLVPGGNNNPVLGSPDRYYDPSAFALPAAGFWGNVARNTLKGPGLVTLDLAVVKDTALGSENRNLQFRAEFFNVLNHPNFGGPVTVVFNSPTGVPAGNAGRITSTNTTSRQIQFALKIIF